MNLQPILEEHAKWLKGEGGARAVLHDAQLRGATLRGADLRGAYLRGAALSEADLRGADLSAADLSGADLSGADLRRADLRRAVLSRANLRDAYLSDAYLSDADLTGADLTGADLTGADLTGADLAGAVLSGADLAGAVLSGADLTEIPTVPQLHTKMLAAIEAGGLEMADWHTCETTHCRAGWAIHLSGDAGRELEKRVGSSAAGAFIIAKSCPYLEKVPNFYDTNENALADIRRCAELEART